MADEVRAGIAHPRARRAIGLPCQLRLEGKKSADSARNQDGGGYSAQEHFHSLSPFALTYGPSISGAARSLRVLRLLLLWAECGEREQGRRHRHAREPEFPGCIPAG